MKRFVFISLLLTIVLAVNAQSKKGFVCTGDNVNVRKGPGTNYAVLISEGSKLQLDKDEVVISKGKKRNGFCYVHVTKVVFGVAFFEYPGWVSAKYLREVAICDECNGVGYVGDIEDMKPCERCEHKGYVSPAR